ncbi:MAG TPA: helix-turn-helix transcriptional regulator [Thermoanaerobacterium sp.]|nr:helix-turn-helix transcriptional regulator [Thermoanaerobacterium sp.]
MNYETELKELALRNRRLYYMVRRKEKNLKLKDVAKYVGCSVSILSRFENGVCNISPDKERKYIEYIENY